MRVLQNCGDLQCCTSTKTTILWGPFLLPLPFPLPVFLFLHFPTDQIEFHLVCLLAAPAMRGLPRLHYGHIEIHRDGS